MRGETFYKSLASAAVLLLLGALIIVAEGTAVAPFIYTIF